MSGGDIWKLRCELVGHEQDIRSICTTTDGSIVTCSRDKSVRKWSKVSPDDRSACLFSHLVSFEGERATV